MATRRRRPVQCAVYRLWRERTACCVALFVLCACVRGVSGQRLYEVEPQSAANPEPRGRSAAGAASPGVSGRLQDANAPITNRFGNRRDGQDTSESEQAQIGPNYDSNNKRFGGTNRNPYRAGSGGYRGRFSGTNFGYEKYDPNRKGEGIGILAGWRPDLQGAERPESVFLNPFSNLQVQTRLGPVTGFRVQLYDRPGLPEELWPINLQPELQKHKLNVSVFLGIPYAQPPVDEGRFKPPRAHPGWQTWMALDFRPACPQPERFVGEERGVREMHEDCLYLNVFSPSLSSNVKEKYAVMVYIHGGEFSHGASNQFPAHMLAAHGEVVVVTFNYRLGALGFLSTGDEYSPGNYGMLDQAMALRWVHENVHYFNGDRSKITVFGPGAGAASAGLLAVAPRTAHMVHQVIAESGSPLAEWAAIYDVWRVQNTSRIFGDKIGCNSDTSFKLLNCLSKGRSYTEIGNVEFKPDVGTFAWAPYIETNTTFPGNDWYEDWRQDDWRFLPDFPEKLYRQRKFNPNLRVLAGANRDEAAFFVYQNRSLAPDFTITQRILDERIREWVKQYNYTLNPDGVYEAIRYMYTYWPDRYNRTWIRQMYVDFLGDALYKAPVDSLVKLAVELDVPTYQYVLNTSVEALKAPFWREIPHDVQYYFLTGGPFMDPEFFPQDVRVARELWTELDRNMSQLFIETFSNFAKYGRPTPRQIFNLVNWQPALHGDLRYLSINNTFNSTMWSNYRQTECAFWSQYLPTVVGHLVPTYRPSTEFWWEPKEPLQIAFWSVTSLAFLLMVTVGICCCLWQGAKKKNERLYEASFMDDAFDVRENNHFASKPSKQPSVASLGGGGLGPGGDAMRGDARSVQQQIQQDRRRRSDAARHLGSADELRAGGGAESSATELEPLQPEQFQREPSRASARSRDTVQYATLEHHGRLTAPRERDTEAMPARQTPQQPQVLPQQQVQRPQQQQLPQRTQQPPQRPQQQLPQQAQQQVQQVQQPPQQQQQPPTRPDPRRLGGVSVLPTANTQAAVAHAKSIPNMAEMEPQRPTAQARTRARSVEALDQDAQSNSSRPGTPKVPHFQFVEPYDVVQLPDDYQYNSNPNLAGLPQRPPSRSEPAPRLQQPAGYVPPETRPVAPPGRPTVAPRAAPVPAVPTSAPPPRPALQHQAQIVVQMASRPQSRGDAITPAPPRQNGSAAAPPSTGTPPPAYSRRTAPPQSGTPDQDSKRVSGAIQESARAAGGWRAGADTPSTSAGYPTAASERSVPDTPSVSTDRSYDSAELEYRQQPRRYVPPETAL